MVASSRHLTGLDWPVPDCSFPRRRRKTLTVRTPYRRAGGPLNLPDQLPEDEDIGAVTADGACDTRHCHGAIIARGGTVIIPICRKG